MFTLLTILLALSLGWLTKKLISSYPHSPHPRRLEKIIRPLTNLAELLIRIIKQKLSYLKNKKSAP